MDDLEVHSSKYSGTKLSVSTTPTKLADEGSVSMKRNLSYDSIQRALKKGYTGLWRKNSFKGMDTGIVRFMMFYE